MTNECGTSNVPICWGERNVELTAYVPYLATSHGTHSFNSRGCGYSL